MIKPTKHSKKITVMYRKCIETYYISEYTCPCCKTLFKGLRIPEYVDRFRCDCGQPLTISKRKKD